MEQERIAIFRRNLPFIVRDDGTVRRIMSHPDNRFIEKRDEMGALIGLSVVNQNVIMLLCVDKAYRQQGIGTWLLEQSEKLVCESGHGACKVGWDSITSCRACFTEKRASMLQKEEKGC